MRQFKRFFIFILLTSFIVMTISCEKKQFTPEDLSQFETAQSLYTDRKFDDARDILIPLSKKYKSSTEAGVLLARIYFFTRDFQKSEETLKNLIENNDSPYASMWLGRVIASDPKRQDEAIEIFRALLRQDPENHAAHYYLGRCLETQGKIQEALLSYQRALAIEYSVSKIHLHMGTVLHGLNMKDRAAQHFKKIEQLNLYPEDVAWAKKLMQGEKNKPSKK